MILIGRFSNFLGTSIYGFRYKNEIIPSAVPIYTTSFVKPLGPGGHGKKGSETPKTP
jgi:hypothetical protein